MLVYQGGQTILPDDVPLWHGTGDTSAEELPRAQPETGVDIRYVADEQKNGVVSAPAEAIQLLQTLEKNITYGRLTSETILLFIQTGVIRTGPNDTDIRLLPRLAAGAAWDLSPNPGTSLDALKGELTSLLQQRQQASLLLMMDLPKSPHDWRLGLQDQQALSRIQDWVDQPPFKDRLVIVQSSAPGQISGLWGQGSNGQTTFAKNVLQELRGSKVT